MHRDRYVSCKPHADPSLRGAADPRSASFDQFSTSNMEVRRLKSEHDFHITLACRGRLLRASRPNVVCVSRPESDYGNRRQSQRGSDRSSSAATERHTVWECRDRQRTSHIPLPMWAVAWSLSGSSSTPPRKVLHRARRALTLANHSRRNFSQRLCKIARHPCEHENQFNNDRRI